MYCQGIPIIIQTIKLVTQEQQGPLFAQENCEISFISLRSSPPRVTIPTRQIYPYKEVGKPCFHLIFEQLNGVVMLTMPSLLSSVAASSEERGFYDFKDITKTHG